MAQVTRLQAFTAAKAWLYEMQKVRDKVGECPVRSTAAARWMVQAMWPIRVDPAEGQPF